MNWNPNLNNWDWDWEIGSSGPHGGMDSMGDPHTLMLELTLDYYDLLVLREFGDDNFG